MAMRGKWQRSSERHGADHCTTSLCVCSSEGLFSSCPSRSLCLYSKNVLFWWSFFQWQASGLYAATVISSSAHTKWPPTAIIIKWQRIWRLFTLLGSMKKNKMLYANDLLITHCILSHCCITFHGKIEFSFVQNTMQRSFITTWQWYIYKKFSFQKTFQSCAIITETAI